MEPGCDAAGRFALLWEEGGGSVSREGDLDDFKAHLSACPECRRRFGPLLALIERDASAPRAPAPDGAFVERVMRGLPPRPLAPPVRRRRAPFPAIAAAAAAVFAMGGFFLARSGALPGTSDLVAIHFTLDAPEAASVFLVGSFSDWAIDDRFRLRRTGAETWDISIRLKRNELYSYGFLVDGEKWLADPRATETIDDGFGSMNSLLRL
jgi:hypothetical protein